MREDTNTPKENESEERRFRRMFHKGALEAPPSPWFTQNVLHRLPDRKRRVAAWIEYALYIVGIICTMAYTGVYVVSTVKSSVVTVNNVMTYAVLVALLVSLCYMVLAPLARKAAR